ncbi:acyltransferase family protein [Pedobacter ghigonis]|uniref:acyltransferase family protein n=1 Tax=Pedobacter ghigonis TaxID=2730403 RepID=UPI00158A54C9|nr:acyltransferase [Pedobacter ghigonis]
MQKAFLTFNKKIKTVYTRLNSSNVVPDFLKKAYFPSLDGWRAVAIILVVLGHSKFTVSDTSLYYRICNIFIYADLGVKLFFVLSGFLITTLLMKEMIANQKINFKIFFIKRVLRIFPVFYLYLIVIAILNHFLNLGLISDHFLGPLLYINNFSFFQPTWLTGHSWSLAVEEQFYIIWPFTFVFFGKNLWIFCLTFILVVPIMKVIWYYFPAYHEILLGPFIDSADSIFSGALLAILSFKGFFNSKQKIWTINGLTACLILIITMSMFSMHSGYLRFIFYANTNLICNFCICVLIIKTLIIEKSRLYSILNHPLMLKLGIISYSLYIWQQLFIMPTGFYNNRISIFGFPFNIIGAVTAAFISYYFFERYMLKLKVKLINQ